MNESLSQNGMLTMAVAASPFENCGIRHDSGQSRTCKPCKGHLQLVVQLVQLKELQLLGSGWLTYSGHGIVP